MFARPVIMTLSLILALMLPSLDGCSKLSPEAKKETHRQRGTAYFEKGQYEEAIIELKNVIQIDPKDTDGHYRLALAFLKLGGLPNLQAAYGELTKTVELDASNQDAQLKLGEMYLASRQPTKAREHAEVVLASAPQNTQGLILHGQSLISEKEFDKGIAELKKAIELDPKHIPTYITLAQAYLQMKDVVATEATLVQAQQADPQSSEARAAMGDFRLLTGKPEQAEAEYKKALELAPDRDVLYLKLAGFYHASGKYEQAENIYKKLTELKPTEEKPSLYLGDYYSFLGQAEKALSSYQRAAELNPASVPAREKLIDHYLDLGRVDEADKLIQPILEKNKKDTAGRFFDARVRLARGKTDEAMDQLQQLIKDEPQLAAAHHYLGLTFMQKNDIPQARRELTESVKLAPNMTENRSALAGLHLAEGSYELAIEQAQNAIRLNGRNLQAATILGDAFLGKGDLTRAKQTFETISKALPKEPYSRYRLGLLAQNEKNHAAALEYFEASLAANPHIIEPLAQIAAIKVMQGKPKEARERVMHQLDISPKNALIYNLLGKLWIQAKDVAQAETAFKQAIELTPDLPISYMNLGELYLGTGRQDQAAKEYEAALAKNPKLVGAHMVLGLLHEQRKEYDKAKARYEEVLKLNPKFAPAANNLAWILSEEGGGIDTIDRALSYAQTAYQLLPNDPNTADTLGWLYYKKTSYLKASNLLKEAAEKLPDNPVVQYHYGMAQHKNGDKAGAKKSLQASLKLNQNFPGAEEAKKVLNDL